MMLEALQQISGACLLIGCQHAENLGSDRSPEDRPIRLNRGNGGAAVANGPLVKRFEIYGFEERPLRFDTPLHEDPDLIAVSLQDLLDLLPLIRGQLQPAQNREERPEKSLGNSGPPEPDIRRRSRVSRLGERSGWSTQQDERNHTAQDQRVEAWVSPEHHRFPPQQARLST
jgi:hypothetical protein